MKVEEIPADVMDAAYAHVESVKVQADAWNGIAPLWHGWAVRDAYVAGAMAYREKLKSSSSIERLAEHLCSEFDDDFLPNHKAHWPEDANDDGMRETGFVAIQPKHVQAHARHQAERILALISSLPLDVARNG